MLDSINQPTQEQEDMADEYFCFEETTNHQFYDEELMSE